MKRCSMGKWLTSTFDIKKRRNLQSGKIAHFAKAIKIIQKMTSNTRK